MCARHSCFIVPPDVLSKLAQDESMPAESRQAMHDTAALEPVWRGLRNAQTEAVQLGLLAKGISSARFAGILAPAPAVIVFDCKNTRSLPGVPVPNPGTSTDITAKRAFEETTAVATFYQQCFGRNSIDHAGMTLISSIHYGVQYANAFWNGSQMTYGDGDGQILTDFTAAIDIIGHELTHGITQFTAGFDDTDEPGALDESMSDVFGSMFRQWRKKQTVAKADWLIGADILGPVAKAKGYTCLRNMAVPEDKQCLTATPQPWHYKDYISGGDPHDNSGVPNHAFYLAATSIGGRSWDKAGKVWYAALTSPKAGKSTNMKAFASLTRAAAKSLFPADPAVYSGVDDAWTQVGIS